MATVETFNEHRPLVFSIAYRMLGSVMDAEDMVQETFLRWQRAGTCELTSPKSYLSTIVTRLCIDQFRSARKQREQYIGPWLPEPLVADETPSVEEHLALADSLSMAFLVLLESLTPTERAAFLLREAFDYEYAEIARILEKSKANCRQLVRRARLRVGERPQRFEVTREQAERLQERFLEAATEGDMASLLELLSDDVILWSDGGGKVAAALNPIYGADKVARLLVALARGSASFVFRLAWVNGQAGLVAYEEGEPRAVLTTELEAGKVCAIRIVVNPDKLQGVPTLA